MKFLEQYTKSKFNILKTKLQSLYNSILSEIEENEIQILKKIKEIQKKFANYSKDWNAHSNHIKGENF